MTKKRSFVLIAIVVIMALSVLGLVACKKPADVDGVKNENNLQTEQTTPNYNGDKDEVRDDEPPVASVGFGFELVGSDENAYYTITDASFANIDGKKYAEIIIPDVHNEKPVKAINNEVFKKFDSLSSVIVLGHNLEIIGDGAFRDCAALASFEFYEASYTGDYTIVPLKSIGNSAFMNCNALGKLVFSDKLETLGLGAFRNCSKLESIVIPEKVTEIPAQTFQGCSGLRYIQLSKETTSIGAEAFDKCTNLLVISENEIEVPGDNKVKLPSSVILPSKVTSLGEKAFNACTKITNITLPEGIVIINEGTFYGCTAMAEVTLQGEIAEIDDNAFRNCSSIKKFTTPSSLRRIGKNAFRNTSKLESITLNQNLHTIDDGAFLLSGIKSINILGGVTYIGKEAFAECKKLSKVVFPATLSVIGDGAFRETGVEKMDVSTGEDGVEIETPTGILEITYEFTGTVEQWNAVIKNGPSFWGNINSQIKIICNGSEGAVVDLVLTQVPVENE